MSTITLGASTSGVTTLNVATLMRNAGGTLLVSGSGLGTSVNLIVASDGSATHAIGGTGTAGSTTMTINPYIVGQDTSETGTAQYGFMTDSIAGTALSTGLRNLTTAEYATTITSGQTQLDNVSLSSALTGIDSATTVNSLRLDAYSSVSGMSTLTINSGGVLALGVNSISTSVLAFGSTEAVFHVYNAALTVNSTITGSGGLTKSGTGVLTLTSANSYTGTTTVASGLLKVTSESALGTNPTIVMGTYVNTILDLSSLSSFSIGSISGGYQDLGAI